ncbi:MAG: hypothetical protein WDO73_23975 [Ignavibacteriota bacterium]
MEQFLLAYDSDLAPVVGQQVTLTAANGASVGPRIDLLIARAGAPFVSKSLNGAVTECDLVAQVALNGRVMGFLWDAVPAISFPTMGSGRLFRCHPAVERRHCRPGDHLYGGYAGSGARIAFAHIQRDVCRAGRSLPSVDFRWRHPAVTARAGRELHWTATTLCASAATIAAPGSLPSADLCWRYRRCRPGGPLRGRLPSGSDARTALARHLPGRLPRRTLSAER